jgi:hypothetical protein
MHSTAKIFLILSIFLLPSNCRAEGKLNVGWLEKIMIRPGNIFMHAKMDTGADYSSLNATHIEEFIKDVENPKEKDGEKIKQKWVRFDLKNKYGQKVTLEVPVRRVAIIKRHGMKSQRRPVVRLGLCIGKSFLEEDVNLVDRSQFEHQMLIGRSFLAGVATIDPSVTYTVQPECPESKK